MNKTWTPWLLAGLALAAGAGRTHGRSIAVRGDDTLRAALKTVEGCRILGAEGSPRTAASR